MTKIVYAVRVSGTHGHTVPHGEVYICCEPAQRKFRVLRMIRNRPRWFSNVPTAFIGRQTIPARKCKPVHQRSTIPVRTSIVLGIRRTGLHK